MINALHVLNTFGEVCGVLGRHHLPRLLAELQQLLQLVVNVVVLAFNLILSSKKKTKT